MPSTEGSWYSCWWMWDLRIPILSPKFSIKLTILTFSTKVAQKESFWSKKKKNKNCHWIIYNRISQGIKFDLKQSILAIWTKFSQEGRFLSKTKKTEQHHWIQHIRISLGIKFHLKATVLSFWTKLSQTGYFRLTTKKVNMTIEFCVFELD